jgi:hypothetical protein
MCDDLWQEIADAPGEIFDLPEMREFADEVDERDVIGYDDSYEGQSFESYLESSFDF